METSAFGAATSAIAPRSSDATILALDAETSALGAETSAIARRSSDATISALDAETSAIARSYRRYRRAVSGDIGDCGVGITPQMCKRVTNHGNMSTFSKPVPHVDEDGSTFFECELLAKLRRLSLLLVSWNSLVCHFVVYLQ